MSYQYKSSLLLSTMLFGFSIPCNAGPPLSAISAGISIASTAMKFIGQSNSKDVKLGIAIFDNKANIRHGEISGHVKINDFKITDSSLAFLSSHNVFDSGKLTTDPNAEISINNSHIHNSVMGALVLKNKFTSPHLNVARGASLIANQVSIGQ